MNIRMLKKKNTLNRAKYIADKIGVIECGVWVEYFKKHPTDLPKVLKRLCSQRYKSCLKRDIRTNYHNPSFDSKYCDWVIWQLENGYFGRYVKLDILNKLNYGLSCIPIFEENLYGKNEVWRDGGIRSVGVNYDTY